jgi:hypothetical protein
MPETETRTEFVAQRCWQPEGEALQWLDFYRTEDESKARSYLAYWTAQEEGRWRGVRRTVTDEVLEPQEETP